MNEIEKKLNIMIEELKFSNFKNPLIATYCLGYIDCLLDIDEKAYEKYAPFRMKLLTKLMLKYL